LLNKPAKLFWNTIGGNLAEAFKDIANELSNLHRWLTGDTGPSGSRHCRCRWQSSFFSRGTSDRHDDWAVIPDTQNEGISECITSALK
jgi:hypothetical protein